MCPNDVHVGLYLYISASEFVEHQAMLQAWRREEALAEVSAALFVDLPASAESAAQVDPGRRQTGFMEQIQAQILSLKVYCDIVPCCSGVIHF